jgi:hypothetical protein
VSPLSNKRLKLPAPGLGRIPFVPQRTSCSSVNLTAPARWGAAAFCEAAHPVKPGPSGRALYFIIFVITGALEVPLSLLYALSW